MPYTMTTCRLAFRCAHVTEKENNQPIPQIGKGIKSIVAVGNHLRNLYANV